jgi:hypothetical protein
MEASPEDCFRDAKSYVTLLKWLYTSRDYRSQFGRLRGHSGIGPEGLGTLGTAAYANVPTRPTNSSNALSERFMVVFLLRVCRRLRVKPASLQRRELYTALQLSD